MAIPLPYAGPFLPGAQGVQPTGTSYDVPVAPPSKAALVGAPGAGNVQSQHNTFKDFIGNTVTHVLSGPFDATPAKGVARREWLPNFLSEGGVEKLVSLLKHLSKFNFEAGVSE